MSLPLSLKWPVWSSSSGNNCHAVHRSLSSGASLWSGTFTLSHIVSQAVFYSTITYAIDDWDGWRERGEFREICWKYSSADNMGRCWNPTVQSQTDAPEEGDLWTAWQLFPLDDDQTCHSKEGGSCIFRWPVIGGDYVGEECYIQLGWQYGTRLKSHDAVTNWCTRRGWPVNCMTVISARWWSNLPFQRRWKLHIPLASYGSRLRGRGSVSISPRGSLMVI